VPGLAVLLGLPASPGTGYSLGVERILLVARELGVAPAAATLADVLVCSVDPAQAEGAAAAARRLRASGPRVVLDVSDRRIDRKLRTAEKLGARAAVFVGEEEVASDAARVRDLATRSQQTVPLTELLEAVARILE
jgi:histidyl-tRNA synthetase